MKNRIRFEDDRVFIRLDRKSGKPLEAVIDRDRLHIVEALDVRWSAMPSERCGYLVKGTRRIRTFGERGKGRRVLVYLHRVVVAAPEACDVRHIDGNGLDSRRANLHIGPVRQKRKPDNIAEHTRLHSGMVRRRGNLFEVEVQLGTEKFSCGTYVTRSDAENAVLSIRTALVTEATRLRSTPEAVAGAKAGQNAKRKRMAVQARREMRMDGGGSKAIGVLDPH